MLLSLGVSEVGSFVGVQSEAESTFESSEMGSKDVRVLGEEKDERVGGKEGKEGEVEGQLQRRLLARLPQRIQNDEE